MFWKNVNLSRFKSLSLVTKLMLFYSVSTMGILAAIGLFLYPTFIKLTEKISETEISNITAECFEKVIIMLLLGSLSAVIFGHFIARQGLVRMREFEEKMEKITADSLHERIDLNEWPKELKSFGHKFNTMIDRIQASYIQLSQFSSDIAHELRTPINNLRGMTEVALSKEKHSVEYQEMLEKYMQEYQYLSKLIENLLFLARSDHGQLALNKECIDSRKEILNISAYYQALADENNITITCTGEAEIQFDRVLFKRMISNLLSNSLKYTQKNGKININIKSEGKNVKIFVSDTGTGISTEHMARIFDRFYRVDSSRSSQSGGLGLGLAIVKSIIDMHKGKITIESNVGSGTSVIITIL